MDLPVVWFKRLFRHIGKHEMRFMWVIQVMRLDTFQAETNMGTCTYYSRWLSTGGTNVHLLLYDKHMEFYNVSFLTIITFKY